MSINMPIVSINGSLAAVMVVLASLAGTARGQQVVAAHEPVSCIRPEQRSLEYRPPERLCVEPVPQIDRQISVRDPGNDRPVYYLGLDEAIQIALLNAEVIRVVTGNTAVSTGSTIYDAAITNTQIDQARGRFDPVLNLRNDGLQNDNPVAVLDPLDPAGARIDSVVVNSFNHSVGISQVKPRGGTASMNFRTSPTNSHAPLSPLDPQVPSSFDVAFTQPLLRGRGLAVNQAPIVIARIDTERSFYQLKNSVQELVRSVIESYWGIVAARADLWARRQQVEQLQGTVDFYQAQLEAGLANVTQVAQARASLASFKAAVVAAEADLINREEALFNALGLPPGSNVRVLPSTPPVFERREFQMEPLLQVAERNRPDIVQSKLALEATQQRLLIAENQVLPQVDATALYRLNGLQGKTPNGTDITSQFGQFTGWQVGMGLSVPLGVRSDRATLRTVELTLARDRANLQQQIHFTSHQIAQSLRNLEQFQAQYRAFREVREAARANLDRQFAVFREQGLRNEPLTFLNLLQAITDWGNAISNEALAISQYNAELARLAANTGTILEEHGIRFLEEDYASIGPCLVGEFPCYPEAVYPAENEPRYPGGDKGAENYFDLREQRPGQRRSQYDETKDQENDEESDASPNNGLESQPPEAEEGTETLPIPPGTQRRIWPQTNTPVRIRRLPKT